MVAAMCVPRYPETTDTGKEDGTVMKAHASHAIKSRPVFRSTPTQKEISMRFLENELLSNILHAIAAIPFGFGMIAVATQLLQYA